MNNSTEKKEIVKTANENVKPKKKWTFWKVLFAITIVLIVISTIYVVIRNSKEFISYPALGQAKAGLGGMLGLFGLFGSLATALVPGGPTGPNMLLEWGGALVKNECPTHHPYNIEFKECAKSGCPAGTTLSAGIDHTCECGYANNVSYKWDSATHTCVPAYSATGTH